jgi:protein TonB
MKHIHFNIIIALTGLQLITSGIENEAFCQSAQTNDSQEKPETKPKSNERVFLVVEQTPEFPGGKSAMQKFISDNLVIPQNEASKKLSGQVFVSFIVNTDGSLDDIVLKKGLSPEYDREAINVVKLMPLWKPGYQSRRRVRVIYLLPIQFP